MLRLPTGTLTFLFTDIEGSTRLLQELGDRYVALLADHHRLLRTAFREHGGEERETQGDGLFFAFPSARAALLAAVAAQRAVLKHPWPDDVSVRVRMGLHTGEPLSGETGYVGIDIHRAARISAAGWGGQILLSQTARDLIQDDLQDGISLRDLGEHRLKDLTRAERVYQVVARDLPADFPPLRSLDTLPNNLPIQLTTLVGREREVADVRRLLTSTRLLTLTGPGGCGKTRLALQVAADLVEHYPQGVWLVDLAPLAESGLVPQSVASVLGVREEQHRPLGDTLADHLRPRNLLLLLDNCEHLLAACARLAERLLQRCPDLRILATSREGLGISGETLYPVPSLSVPDLNGEPRVDTLVQYESVRLFVERAMTRLPTFAMTNQNASAVAQVCRRLDGLPLAIELAVARIAALPVEQIAGRLDDRFRLLTGGSRTAVPHHQTLQALIDWSHDLLSEAERTLFCRLSVFAGGWTLESAEAVCAGDGLQGGEILDQITQLVAKSLVVAETQGGEARYRFLETVRQYAREKPMASSETDHVRSRHFQFFLRFAEEAEPRLRTIEQLIWLRRLELERDNVRSALDWTRGRGDVESGLRLASAFFRFWYIKGHFNEGRGWLEDFLASADPSPTRVRARALRAAAMLARAQGDYAAARARFDESMAIFRELGDQQSVVDVLLGIAWFPAGQGDLAAARAILDEALTVARSLGYEWGVAESFHILGHVEETQGEYGKALSHFEESVARFRALGNKRNLAHPLTDLARGALRRGDYVTARSLFEESQAVFREFGDKQSIADSLTDLGGQVALAQGDDATARALFEEGLGLYRQLGDKVGMVGALNELADVAQRSGEYQSAKTLAGEALTSARALGSKRGTAEALRSLGFLASRQGEYDQAVAHFKESLGVYRHLGNKAEIQRLLEGMAMAVGSQRQPLRAARLLGAAEALREALGVVLHTADRPDHDRAVADIRSVVGEEAFNAAWAGGRTMALEQAIEYALREDASSL